MTGGPHRCVDSDTNVCIKQKLDENSYDDLGGMEVRP